MINSMILLFPVISMFIVHKTFAMQKYAVIRNMTSLTQATVSDSKYMAIIRTTLTFVT